MYFARCAAFDNATRNFDEALAIARAYDDRIDEAISVGSLAMIAWYQGDYAQARPLAEESRRIAHAADEDWAESFALLRLGMLAFLRRENPTAKTDLEYALGMTRRHEDPFWVALTLEFLGLVAMTQVEHEDAYVHFAEGLRLLDDVGDRSAIANYLESFAALAAARSMTERALRLAGAAAAIREATFQSQRRGGPRRLCGGRAEPRDSAHRH